MVRSMIVVALLIVVMATTGPAAAQGCTTKTYYHGGSIMAAKSCTERLTITYKIPRRELIQRGVKSGTMLFTGREDSNGAIRGHVQVFQQSCGPIAFAVTGSRKAGSIILDGQIPARDSTCKVVRKVGHIMQFTDQPGAAPSSAPTLAAGGQQAASYSPKVRAYVARWDKYVKAQGITRAARYRLNIQSCKGCVPFMIHCKKPVSGKADLRGRRVRTHSRKPALQFVRGAGGKAVILPGGEIKQALSSGVIDCALSGGLRPK